MLPLTRFGKLCTILFNLKRFIFEHYYSVDKGTVGLPWYSRLLLTYFLFSLYKLCNMIPLLYINQVVQLSVSAIAYMVKISDTECQRNKGSDSVRNRNAYTITGILYREKMGVNIFLNLYFS